jgi:hypothetical protein
MADDSLLAHLALRFVSSVENIATEALAYVLSRSEAAAKAMLDYARLCTPDLAGPLQFVTQDWDADDAAIPDLVGVDATNSRPLIIEAKFDAGLTANQPNTYLLRLPANRPGVLITVVPARRVERVWGELVTRAAAVFDLSDERAITETLRVASLGASHVMAITTWDALLAYLHAAVDATPGDTTGRDIEQLQGLCARLDEAAFIPLRADDLAGVHGRRLLNYLDLINHVSDRLVSSGIASARDAAGKALGWSAGTEGWWGRYFSLSGCTCLLRVTAHSWARLADTPIWLQVGYRGSPPVAQTRAFLSPLLATSRTAVFERDSFVDVAMWLPIGAEHDEVIHDIVDQVTRVATCLAHALAEQTSDHMSDTQLTVGDRDLPR